MLDDEFLDDSSFSSAGGYRRSLNLASAWGKRELSCFGIVLEITGKPLVVVCFPALKSLKIRSLKTYLRILQDFLRIIEEFSRILQDFFTILQDLRRLGNRP